MPYRPGQRRHMTKTTLIKMDDGSFNVTYKPGAITHEMLDDAQDDEGSADIRFAEMVIISWELEDDEGQTIPVTEAAIRANLDIPVLGYIVGEVIADARPGEGRLKRLRRG